MLVCGHFNTATCDSIVNELLVFVGHSLQASLDDVIAVEIFDQRYDCISDCADNVLHLQMGFVRFHVSDLIVSSNERKLFAETNLFGCLETLDQFLDSSCTVHVGRDSDKRR